MSSLHSSSLAATSSEMVETTSSKGLNMKKNSVSEDPSATSVPSSSPPASWSDEMMEHDDMFKDKIDNQDRLPPRTLFGISVKGIHVEINDEVRLAVWILFLLLIVVAIAFFVVAASTQDVSWDTIDSHSYGIAVIVAGTFAFFASIVSFYQVHKHWTNYSHPPSQHLVIRILFMVPVYSTSAFLSLCFLNYSTYFDFLRTCYESFVIYSFMILLTKYLGGQDGVLGWLNYKPPIEWLWPMNYCLKAVPADDRFLRLVKYGALQYTLITPVVSVAAVIMTTFGVYGDGVVQYNGGYIYVAFVQNCTQLVSLYCLAWLYFVMRNELAPFKPVAKFLVVKSVVFFTFWQSVGLAILVWVGVIQKTDNFDVGQIQIGLQDFIVCIEMFIAAAVHRYTFGYETYANGSLKLIMEQRAVYLAQTSYKMAVENQKRRQKRKEQAEMKAVSASAKVSSSGSTGGAVTAVASLSSISGPRGSISSQSETPSPSEQKMIESRAERILHNADLEGEVVLTDDATSRRLRFMQISANDPENDLQGNGVATFQPVALIGKRVTASDDYEELGSRF